MKAIRLSGVASFLLLGFGVMLASATAGLSLENLRRVLYRTEAAVPQMASWTPFEGLSGIGPLRWASDAASNLAACGRTSLSSTVVLGMREFSRINQAEDYLKWSDALIRTTKAVQRSLRCSPADGFRWAQYAYLVRSAASLPDQIVPLLETSQRLSPSDAGSILLRIVVWWALPDDVVEPSKARAADMALFLADADAATVAHMLETAPQAALAEAREVYGSLAPQRQLHLKAAGIFAASTVKGEERTLQDLLSGPSPFGGPSPFSK